MPKIKDLGINAIPVTRPELGRGSEDPFVMYLDTTPGGYIKGSKKAGKGSKGSKGSKGGSKKAPAPGGTKYDKGGKGGKYTQPFGETAIAQLREQLEREIER
jgi:hypothetical protein